MIAPAHRLAALALALAACAPPSQIGPFVKTITRVGDSLSVVSCDIILQGTDLYEGQCYAQRITLHAPPPPDPTPAPAP